MNRGGRRAGAGTPTAFEKATKADAAKNVAGRFQERAAADFDRIYDALSDLAFGVWVEDEEHGRVYRRPPDRGALQTLIEHLKGKAATAAVQQPDTLLTLVAKNVPRPRRGNGNEGDGAAGPAGEGAGGGEPGGEGVAPLGDVGGGAGG